MEALVIIKYGSLAIVLASYVIANVLNANTPIMSAIILCVMGWWWAMATADYKIDRKERRRLARTITPAPKPLVAVHHSGMRLEDVTMPRLISDFGETARTLNNLRDMAETALRLLDNAPAENVPKVLEQFGKMDEAVFAAFNVVLRYENDKASRLIGFSRGR